MKNGDCTIYQYHGLTFSYSQDGVSRLELPSCLKQLKQMKYETREWTSGIKGSDFVNYTTIKLKKRKKKEI